MLLNPKEPAERVLLLSIRALFAPKRLFKEASRLLLKHLSTSALEEFGDIWSDYEGRAPSFDNDRYLEELILVEHLLYRLRTLRERRGDVRREDEV